MLKKINSLQLIAPPEAAESWISLLGAEHAGEDRIDYLAARRTLLRLGQGYVELLQPDGDGPVAAAMAARGRHLFAAGASTDDFDGLMAHLESQGVSPTIENGRAYLDGEQTGGHGLRLVIGPEENLPSVGDIDFLYEATLLVEDADAVTADVAKLFKLDADNFVAIDSPRYGYHGYLTLFVANQLGRFEIITPTDPGNTMGRYFARNGESYYMCYAETDRLPAIEERVATAGTGHTPQRPEGQKNPDVVFLHHTSMGGMMLGLSRRTRAWHWSGQPDQVEAVE